MKRCADVATTGNESPPEPERNDDNIAKCHDELLNDMATSIYHVFPYALSKSASAGPRKGSFLRKD